MSDLRSLQCRFQNYLIGTSDDIEADIISTADALAEHRLGAYFNAYRIRLIEALAVDYSALKKYLGAEAFDNLALEYLQAHPSCQPSIRWFGKKLAEYISSNYVHKEREFLSELANFEWSKGLIFDASDETHLIQLNEMAQIPPTSWQDIRIKFQPAIQYLDFYWNVCPYYAALDQGTPLPDKHRHQYPHRWLVWRKNHDPYWRSLEVHEAWAFESAQRGANFAELCQGLLEWIPQDQVPMAAAGLLKQWINDHLIRGIDY